jgi:hypothetical protein
MCSNTKAGRAEVQKRLGDNAQVLVDAMLSATEKRKLASLLLRKLFAP